MRKIFSVLGLVFAITVMFASAAEAQNGKSDICHKSGDTFTLINVSNKAVSAHLAHGDALPGMPVPNMSGYEFSTSCQAVLMPPDFFPFYIRNNNTIPLPQRISPPWDNDMSIVENADGDGFSALTPNTAGGQKVGYGTNYFDGLMLKNFDSVNWVKVSGAAGLVAYLNVWVTDGTNYAIIGSENDYRGTNFATRTEWKVFEYSGVGTESVSLDWLCANGGAGRVNQYLTCGGSNATLASLSNVIIQSPSVPYPSYVGSGAPRGGYGFNVIFGDTQSNFIGSYILENLTVTVSGIAYSPTSQDLPTN